MTRVFVGSSTEALHYAERICNYLAKTGGVSPVLWTGVFSPGLLTLEALERELDRAMGAVLIASPDDELTIRGETVRVPRSNVLFELGLFSSRLTRPSIALCHFEGATLPTDLHGFTYVPMGAFTATEATIGRPRLQQLRAWASALPPHPVGVARTELLHGYSGVWDCSLRLKRWRNRDLAGSESVGADGELHLVIPVDRDGTGVVHGELNVEALDHSPDTEAPRLYKAKIAVVDRVSMTRAHGACLSFVSRTFAREVKEQNFSPTAVDGASAALSGTTVFEWDLEPADTPGSLKGTYRTRGDQRSFGDVWLRKHSSRPLTLSPPV